MGVGALQKSQQSYPFNGITASNFVWCSGLRD